MDSEPQSFIIKFWLEKATDEQKEIVWHCQVTHVPSGVRRYLKTSDQLLKFMTPYLEAMGINFSRHHRFWRRRERQ